jgi:hypothetical protein
MRTYRLVTGHTVQARKMDDSTEFTTLDSNDAVTSTVYLKGYEAAKMSSLLVLQSAGNLA